MEIDLNLLKSRSWKHKLWRYCNPVVVNRSYKMNV